jgi:phosphoglycerate dehydrogenase-like enzyme
VFTRLLGVVLDPRTAPERTAAFAEFVAHDEPDFAGWCEALRAEVPSLVPADVRLVTTPGELRDSLPEAVAVVVEAFPIGAAELAHAPALRVVQKFGTNVRTIDVDACARRAITVRTQRRRSNVACAEWVIAMAVALGKRLPELTNRVTAESLGAIGYPPRPFPGVHTARNNWARVPGLRILDGAVLGLIGFGEIGREIAQRARPFGLHTRYYQRTPLPPNEEREYGVSYAALDDLLATSDIISIQLPAGPATRGFLDRTRLVQMKPGAMLLNVARADLIDRDALVAALQAGRLGGFALDPQYEVPVRADDPLLGCANVILTPHIAAQPRGNALADIADITRGLAADLQRSPA